MTDNFNRLRAERVDWMNKRLRFMATRKARIATRGGTLSDMDALIEDLVIAGWIGYMDPLGGKMKEGFTITEGVRWNGAAWAMSDAWCRWIFHFDYSHTLPKINRDVPLPEEDFQSEEDGQKKIDFRPLVDLSPTAEQAVFGREVLDHFERAFGKMRKPEIYRRLLRTIIGNGDKDFGKDELASLGLSDTDKWRRMRWFRDRYNDLIGDRPQLSGYFSNH